MILKERLEAKIPVWRERVRTLVAEKGDAKVGDVTVAQIYGGMRGVRCLVTDISSVDPSEGIRLRGFSIPELLEKLPKQPGARTPLVGGLYYLLLVGEIPSLEEALSVEEEWNKRSEVPAYVHDVLKAMPGDSHPMTLFSQAILAMQRESVFAKRYLEGMNREDYWEAMLEDSLDLTARAPAIAAFIYHMKHAEAEYRPADLALDWAANFGHMMGVEKKEYEDLSRLYFIIHSDHESGNVSAHATYLVASTLSDIYYSAAAAMNGLAGPLHGLANQQSLAWLREVYDTFGRVPSRDELVDFANQWLDQGRVIPGYGHAVLRKTDPRFTALYEFGAEYLPDDELYKLASLIYETIPGVLDSLGKVKNPWPNVDAISGTIQQHYGVQDCDSTGSCGFYTVLFGVSRLLGVSANVIWARALMQPIERPKSLTTEQIEAMVQAA